MLSTNALVDAIAALPSCSGGVLAGRQRNISSAIRMC
jgi:hypothetical protein